MKKREIMTLVSFYAIFIIFTIIVKAVDVQAIGPMGSEVGLASLNRLMLNSGNINQTLYKITEVLGYISLLVCVFFGIVGLLQIIQRKSIKKVDPDILLLGGFYIVVLAFYALFEKVIINYRPVIMDEGLEASYPSSHTMLVVCVMSTAIIQIGGRISDVRLKNVLKAAAIVVTGIMVAGRLLCGVHWLTDIIGGILLSLALIYTYYLLYNKCKRNEA
jgi:undecaprenyl-diphosphatase